MSRKHPPIPAPNSFAGEKKSVLPYRIQLLTPVMGGGVKSFCPDETNPIRTPSVKGQLRFWWRTMQQVNSPEELMQREAAIWGGAVTLDSNEGKASSVILNITEVDSVNKRLERDEKGMMDYKNFPGYVLFPLQGQKDKNSSTLIPSFTLITSCSFSLEIRCPQEMQKEVEMSVKLWLLFGGIGARTTRGCGSLYCEEVMKEFSDGEAIGQFVEKCSSVNSPAFGQSPVPLLAQGRFAFSPGYGSDPVKIWKEYLEKYKNFRQDDAKEKKFGRTSWADADGIRLLTKKYDKHLPHFEKPYFPRAAYGLPVLYKFKDNKGDPEGTFEVRPVGGKTRTRWPSPVILKIIRLSGDNYINVCLLLNSTIPDLELFQNQSLHSAIPQDAHPRNWCNHRLQKGAKKERERGENPYDALFKALGVKEAKS
ncbi:type III-B CRISPR module RAMP protein Cmr1 [Desulforhopalus vacuolatus]|uniref:type III-B CRISPR module RAMP protein Cmr1 n=1 Tax=Desulforhopalus vacuolatus TaxID=40414 RepID=UPI001964865C|nr:type III-B CRISPR module RAMP protein Cmr1 [Desulforhopalus vacuolatus]MBM9520413.1 type III-B CRISPR module RAMP protein Cmr1 [Desulforhopalus vacuolatus]